MMPPAERRSFGPRAHTSPSVAASTMATQPPIAELAPTVIVEPLVDQRQQVASYWHTLFIVVVILAISLSGQTRSQKVLSTGSRPLLYTSAIVMQWTLVGVVWLGIKRRGYSIRQLTGRAWRNFDDVLIDVAVSAAFWLGSVSVLAALGF